MKKNIYDIFYESIPNLVYLANQVNYLLRGKSRRIEKEYLIGILNLLIETITDNSPEYKRDLKRRRSNENNQRKK